MNAIITPFEDIVRELQQIDSFLNITCSENVEEIVLRGNDLAVYIARSGKLLADAKFHLDVKMRSETMEVIRETARNAKATATAINKIVASLCADEQYTVNWAERTNRSATHQLDWCRTLISKAKEEMKTIGMYNHH